ncbi:MAG: hypothetical protein ABSA92_07410 [Candidatus Bathyarchaeia archaeon]
MPVETIIRIPIRKIHVVVNSKDPLSPELALDDFRKLFGKDPDPEEYRIVNIEVITSPDDQQPMLVTECGRYSRFVRRERDSIYFRKRVDVD